MTGALGSTFVAQKYWDAFAVGAAHWSGIPVVIGENVVGVDLKSQNQRRATERKGKSQECSPELERRIDTATCATTTGMAPLSSSSMWKTPVTAWPNIVADKYGDKVASSS